VTSSALHPRPEALPPDTLPSTRAVFRRSAPGILVAAVLGGLLLWGAMRYRRPEPAEPPRASGLDVESAGTVRVDPAAPQWKVLKLGSVEKAESGWSDPVPGRVKIDDRLASRIGVPLAGRVTSILVDLGQKVAAGDPLFAVSSPDIADLRAQKEKAEVDLDAARVVLDRVKAMVAAHALPAKEELAAEQQTKQAEVAVRLAASKLDSLHVAPGDEARADVFVVVSSREGIVVEKNIVMAQEVAPGGAADPIVVADLSSVIVVADLFEDEATEVPEGTTAEVSMARVSRAPAQGVVDRVSAVVDPGRHTVPVRVRVPNPDGILRPNAYATVRFATQADPRAVQVPAAAIVSDGARQYVYVWGKDDRFTRREVVVGAARGGEMILLDGLHQGETVLVEGGILLDNQIRLGGS
jgi:cobalt-zinc-cadmium efflux system membrane fusion protein